jgi:hypothetical protein
MKDRDFERILEDWARHETRSAPDMSPSPAMYQMLRAYQEPAKPSRFFRRWLALSGAAAALLVLAVIYPALFGPSPGPSLWTGRDLEIVGLRTLPVSKKGPGGTGPEGLAASEKDGTRGRSQKREGAPEKDVVPMEGPKLEAVLFSRLEFHFRTQESQVTLRTDIRGPREEAIGLSSSDSYRLLIEPVAELYIYVFQLSPSGTLVMLFPNETYSPYHNPIVPGQPYRLPPEPAWFHAGSHKGKEHLYVLASTISLADLEGLYTEYREETISPRKSATLPDLLKRIEDLVAGGRDDAAGWMFVFYHR